MKRSAPDGMKSLTEKLFFLDYKDTSRKLFINLKKGI
jgi:hypothetical protein